MAAAQPHRGRDEQKATAFSPLPFGTSPSEPGLWQCPEWYLPKRSFSSQRMLRSSLPSVRLLVAELTRRQEPGAKAQSQYVAFLLIHAHHQLAQGLQEISPGREANCPDLSRSKGEDAGCRREASPTPSMPLGIPPGEGSPCAREQQCGMLQLRAASLGWLAGGCFPPSPVGWRTLRHPSGG